MDQAPPIDFLISDETSTDKVVPRQALTEIERESLHVKEHYGEDIDEYQRELEQYFNVTNSLMRHKITPALRARMVDWMI